MSRRRLTIAVSSILGCAWAGGLPEARTVDAAGRVGSVAFTVDLAQKRQRIDGFGVNVTPAQWRGGALAPTLDRLVDDLGVSLVRLDCTGNADWLDPARRGADGHWPEDYLAGVYGRPVFRDCWETFRRLSARGAEVHLNVSGRIPAPWRAADGRTLADHESYAEMVATLVRWARVKQGLRFRVVAPFNETDLGPPEGPAVAAADLPKAVRAVARRLDAAGLGDVGLVVMCDANPAPLDRYRELLADDGLRGRVAAFSGHTYGDGDEQDASGSWYDQERPSARFVEAVAGSRHAAAAVWMTEYGDLDQTGVIEWQVAWRSARRLLKLLEDGVNAALAWDAFDNLHEHDGAWTTYGLLSTDRSAWRYTPRKRYFAARQVYRFVRPGFERVSVGTPPRDGKDVYATWHDISRHVRLLAFSDGADLTIVGMSRIEGDVTLELSLRGLPPSSVDRRLAYYRTSRREDCHRIGDVAVSGGLARLTVPEGSIFTLTTRAAAPR